MIGYTTIGTNDLPRAEAFYDALFEVTNFKRLASLGARGRVWGISWDRPVFSIAIPYDKSCASPGNGNLVALSYKNTAQVDAVYSKAIELGAVSDSGAFARSENGVYSAYFRGNPPFVNDTSK